MHRSPWSIETADILEKQLQNLGFLVFLDRSSIPSGSHWRQYLLRSVSECTVFLAVLDHDAPASEWVLAENAYAAMLRKSIGKPKILLVLKSTQGIEKIQKGEFGSLYHDIFWIPPAMKFGAGILVKGNEAFSIKILQEALDEIRSMQIIGQ